MTEILSTGTLSLKSNKQAAYLTLKNIFITKIYLKVLSICLHVYSVYNVTVL